jgi:hypothetical protein
MIFHSSTTAPNSVIGVSNVLVGGLAAIHDDAIDKVCLAIHQRMEPVRVELQR